MVRSFFNVTGLIRLVLPSQSHNFWQSQIWKYLSGALLCLGKLYLLLMYKPALCWSAKLLKSNPVHWQMFESWRQACLVRIFYTYQHLIEKWTVSTFFLYQNKQIHDAILHIINKTMDSQWIMWLNLRIQNCQKWPTGRINWKHDNHSNLAICCEN